MRPGEYPAEIEAPADLVLPSPPGSGRPSVPVLRRLSILAILVALALLLEGAIPGGATWLGRDEVAHPAGSGVPPVTSAAPGLTKRGPATAAERTALAQALLDQRAAAIQRRDWAGFAATIDPAAAGFRETQEAMFEDIKEVPFESWAYHVTAIAPFGLPPDRRDALGDDAFTAAVTTRYRIAGYDQTATSFDAYYTFVRRDGAWYVASDADGAGSGHVTQTQLWDLGPVTVVHGERSIVLGIGAKQGMQRHAALADAAVSRVSAVWGSAWDRKVMVIVPDTQEHMAALLGADEDRYTQIAAITRADRAQQAADRVMINPAVWRKLDDRGRGIVMTHEVTHVATRSSNSDVMPLWLSEGFADYVGYRGTGVPRHVAAEELLDAVRAEGPPAALPSDADFDPHAAGLTAAYQEGWLAVLLIADEYGEEHLIHFYIEVGTPDGSAAQNLDAAFREEFGTTTAEFTTAWRSFLQEQAQ